MDQKPGKVIIKSVAALLLSMLCSYFTVLYIKSTTSYFTSSNSLLVIFLPAAIIAFYVFINNLLIKVFTKQGLTYICLAGFLSNVFFWNSGYFGLLVIVLLFLLYLPIKLLGVPKIKYVFFANLLTLLVLFLLFLASDRFHLLSYTNMTDDWDLLNMLQLSYGGFFTAFLTLANANLLSAKEQPKKQ
jgi:hypothetical protein